MKRVLIGLVLATLLAASVPATAALTTITSPPGTVQAGWNLLTLPGIPIDPAAESVFTGFNVDSTLYRWDAAVQGIRIYDPWDPTRFGNILFTDGYWLQSDVSGAVSFQGLDDNNSMDVWVSLPKAGWALIGNPYNRDFVWENAKVVDGNVTISIQEAAKNSDPAWLDSLGFWWDSDVQGLRDIGIADDYVMYDTMYPWHGYWIQSYVDKIALIFESS